MKRVLSIDLDYIAKPNIEDYNPDNGDDFFHTNPHVRWDTFFEFSGTTANNVCIDVENLIFCYRIFLKALKDRSTSISFGYEHDAIMYSIENLTDIELIHIDHHDDFLDGQFSELSDKIYHKTGVSRSIEYEQIIKNKSINEGNWISWLNSKNKISKFTWICNENSGNKERNSIISSLVKDYQCITKDEVNFSSYYFDEIFICLSPQYISPQHWHYFSMFMIAYEEFTGKSSKDCWITDKKYTIENYYNKITEKIIWL
jgi:hypothetical protein